MVRAMAEGQRTKRTIEPAHLITAGVALAIFVATLRTLLGPVFADPSLFARYDWDTALAHRYAVALALRRYHELPWYKPWF
jgi:hypothetical protein